MQGARPYLLRFSNAIPQNVSLKAVTITAREGSAAIKDQRGKKGGDEGGTIKKTTHSRPQKAQR